MAAGESGVDVTLELPIGVPLSACYRLSVHECLCVLGETGTLRHVQQLETVTHLRGLEF